MTEQQENKKNRRSLKAWLHTLSKKQLIGSAAVLAAICIAAALLLLFQGPIFNQTTEELARVKKGNASAVQKDKERKETLVVAAETMTGEVNPVFAQSDQDRQICDLVFEPLMKRRADGGYDNVLAERVEIAEEGKEFLITLKEGITFSDGSAMTADDVYASLAAAAFIKGMEEGSGYRNLEGMTQELYTSGSYEMPGIEIVDENTVKLVFSEASSENLKVLETYVQKRDIADMNSDFPFGKIDDFRNQGIGTGAYEIKDQPNGNLTILKASENSRMKAKDIKEIRFVHVNYYDVLSAMKKSEVDVVVYNGDTSAFEEVYGAEGFHVYEKPGSQLHFIGFNNQSIYGSSKKLRQAVAQAFHKQVLFEEEDTANKVMQADSCLPGTAGTDSLTYNPDEAKKKVKSVMETLGTDQIVLRLPVLKENDWQNKIAKQLQEDLEAVGIVLEVTQMDSDTYMSTLFSDEEFDLYLSSAAVTAQTDSLQQLLGGQETLPTSIHTEALDKALEKLKSGYTAAAFQENLIQMNKALSDDLPVIPVARAKSFYAVSADLRGYDMQADSLGIQGVENIKVR